MRFKLIDFFNINKLLPAEFQCVTDTAQPLTDINNAVNGQIIEILSCSSYNIITISHEYFYCPEFAPQKRR